MSETDRRHQPDGHLFTHGADQVTPSDGRRLVFPAIPGQAEDSLQGSLAHHPPGRTCESHAWLSHDPKSKSIFFCQAFGVYFSSYQYTLDVLKDKKTPVLVNHLLAGGIAGSASWLVVVRISCIRLIQVLIRIPCILVPSRCDQDADPGLSRKVHVDQTVLPVVCEAGQSVPCVFLMIV